MEMYHYLLKCTYCCVKFTYCCVMITDVGPFTCLEPKPDCPGGRLLLEKSASFYNVTKDWFTFGMRKTIAGNKISIN